MWFVGRKMDTFAADTLCQDRTSTLSVRSADKALAKYYTTTRRVFADPLFMQISLDACNVMGKSMVLGLAALPDTRAVVYPPQVGGGGLGGGGVAGSCSTRFWGL